MYRLTLLASSLLLATSAFAGQGSEAQPGPAVTVASIPPAPAAADKVYPPLPTLTMLPPATDDDDEPPARPTSKKKKVHAQDRRSVPPMAHLVVSDASHAYLGGIEKQLDLALAR